MSEFNRNPQSDAERLITEVFAGRESEAVKPGTRLRLENLLASSPRRPRVRNSLKVLAFLTGLLLLGGWASTIPLTTYDDGQQITIQLPGSFEPASYPVWVAIFARHAAQLSEQGAHSLVVDYVQDNGGKYYIQLGIIGTDYEHANTWIRQVMNEEERIGRVPYAITQPLVPYRISVHEMIAFQLGNTTVVERNVVLAWIKAGESPTKNGFIYLISRPKDYHKRISTVNY